VDSTYDGLDRLKEFRRGTLSLSASGYGASITADDKGRQQWDLDVVGNWSGFRTSTAGGQTWDLNQTRLHNKANEIDDTDAHADNPSGSIDGGWILPKYDACGNLTEGPKAPMPGEVGTPEAIGRKHVYDAWNRLVKVTDSADAVIAEYRYDALSRRIRAYTEPNGYYWTVRGYYYNAQWQNVEVRKNTGARTGLPAYLSEPVAATAVHAQYVWSPRYVDAPILRDRNADGNMQTGSYGKPSSGLEERCWYTTDGNGNVTTLLDSSGAILERYVYEPYGKTTIYDATWSTVLAWANTYQNEILYGGYRFDAETGLYHVRNRVYHPTLGRWLQRDPKGYVDGMSLYEYVGGCPLSHLDPTGLWLLDAIQGALDVVGMIPGPIGTAASLTNAGVSLARGDYEGAALNAAGAIPVAGAAIKVAAKVGKVAKAAKAVVQTAKTVEAATTVVKTAEKGIEGAKLLNKTVGVAEDAAKLVKTETKAGTKVATAMEATDKTVNGVQDIKKIERVDNAAEKVVEKETAKATTSAAEEAGAKVKEVGSSGGGGGGGGGRGGGGGGKPSLTAHKEALEKVHEEVGKLPNGEPGSFGSPQAGDSTKGYRLDPGHPRAAPDSPDAGPHFNWWDWINGKRGKGGRQGAVPI
jgi:RHS repeat-associated protein